MSAKNKWMFPLATAALGFSVTLSAQAAVCSSDETATIHALPTWFTEAVYKKLVADNSNVLSVYRQNKDGVEQSDSGYTAFKYGYEKLQCLRGDGSNKPLTGSFASFIHGSGTDATKNEKIEVAAFFANIRQETAGLTYRRELCANDSGVPLTAVCKGYSSDLVNGYYYYGRGALQLSWDYNYAYFGEAVKAGGFTDTIVSVTDADIYKTDPDRIATKQILPMLSAMWHWNEAWTNHHQVLLGEKTSPRGYSGFGGTIDLTNGALECGTGISVVADTSGLTDDEKAENLTAAKQKIKSFSRASYFLSYQLIILGKDNKKTVDGKEVQRYTVDAYVHYNGDDYKLESLKPSNSADLKVISGMTGTDLIADSNITGYNDSTLFYTDDDLTCQ